MPELKLTPEQQAVVENRGGSLLVSAAAGSGKTKVLVERLFRAVTEERCDVDDFLIITYTKAAAAELRSKIAAELNRRIGQNPGDRHLRRQMLLVYQADIRTVDAFCTTLLRENTHLLEREEDSACLSPDFRVLDENEARMLRERVLARTLENFYDRLDDGGELLADTLGFGRDDRRLESLVLELYEKIQSHAYPEKWLAENETCWADLEGCSGVFRDTVYCRTLLSAVVRKAEYWQRQLAGVESRTVGTPFEKGYADRLLEAAAGLGELEGAAAAGDWDATRERADGVSFRALSTPRGTKDDPLAMQVRNLWGACKNELKKIRTLLNLSGEEAMEDLRAAAPAMTALLRLTVSFSEAYRREKLRRNAADFSDQEHLALKILVKEDGSPTELGAQIAARYREIMVDEYQDTNEVQNSIFRAVSRNGENLFTVGDVKQSIYRFRLADPTIFLKKYNTFKPYTEARDGEARKILLSKNFRSRQEILDAANFIFANILSTEMGEMEYGEDEALHFGAAYYPARQDCGTEFHLICAQQKRGSEDHPVKRLTAEARFVALRIRQLLDEKFQVTQNDGSLRPCRPEDIVVLMRSPGSRTPDYAAALAEQRIPCSFRDSGDYFSSMEISVMLAMLTVIDNPHQDVPLISVLRSPLFAFTPDRLAKIRAATPDGDYFTALKQSDGTDCRKFLALLTELRLLARDMSVHRLLWHIYNRLNVLGIFGAMDHGRVRKENLIALTEHAERFEGSGYRGVFAFVTQLNRLIKMGRAPETRGAGTEGGVQIMSIHSSKGLEFPIVILTDLDHTFSRKDLEPPVLVHPQLGLGPVRVDLERRIQYPTMARRALEAALLRENKSEEQRILYVAMTRPKEKLILVDTVFSAEKRIADLMAVTSCPVLPEAVAGGKSFGDWILMPLLCRPEAAPLRMLAGVNTPGTYTGGDAPWQVFVHRAEDFRDVSAQTAESAAKAEQTTIFDPALLEYVYPWQRATELPAKLTATQLKGREADSEIAENAAAKPYLRPLTQPRFRQPAGLTAAEAGTATHLVLQYLDFADRDVAGQIRLLKDRRLLTEEQANAVPAEELERFLRSPLAEELRHAEEIRREYRFTLLIDASEYDPADTFGDSILLQGIVDCCFTAPDGSLTVVDFKTDRVTGERLLERADGYRPQIEAYSKALTRVLERPVKRKILYFLYPSEQVEV